MATKNRLITTGLLLAISLLGVALRLYELDADSLWFDEIMTAHRPVESASSGFHAAYLHPPLAEMVTRFFMTIAGDSDFVLRFQAMLFGSLSILLTYKAGALLWTTETGLVGAFVLAVSRHHVQYSQEARPYALMGFLALLSLVFLVKALQTGKNATWFGFALCTSLSLYNHYFAFLFLPAEVVFAAWVIAEGFVPLGRKEDPIALFHTRDSLTFPARQGLMFSLCLALVGLSFVPWLGAMQAHTTKYAVLESVSALKTGTAELSLSILRSVFIDFSSARGVGLVFWVTLFLLGLAVSERKRIALVGFWIGMAFVFFAIVKTTRTVYPRYVIFALPLYVLPIAAGLVAVGRWLDRSIRSFVGDQKWLPMLVCTLGVLVLGGLSLERLRGYYLWQKEDWRGAAQYLADNMAPGDVILADGRGAGVVRDAEWASVCLTYYLHSLGIPDSRVLQVNGQLGELLQDHDQNPGEVWAVLSYNYRPRAWNAMQEITVIDFHEVPIIRLRESSGAVLQDAASMLRVLLDLLTPEAQFNIHLALADVQLRTDALEKARSELEIASQLVPDTPWASRALEQAFAELESSSRREDAQARHRLWRNAGDSIALLEYSVRPERVEAGEAVVVTLVWQALAEMDRDYSVFIHVLDQAGGIWAQEDRVLRQVQYGGRATSSWHPDEKALEEYLLKLAPDTPAGPYTIVAGVYFWETGERMPVWDEDGQRTADDTITLDTVTVIE